MVTDMPDDDVIAWLEERGNTMISVSKKKREEIFRENRVGAWGEPEAVPDESLQAKCARLEAENAKLRWYLKDIRRLLDRVPDHSLPRSVRFRQWSQQTLVEMATRTAPRIAVIWGGAATVAYIVHLIVR